MIISCAKTNLPILGGSGWEGHPFSRTVLLRTGRPAAAGWFDGDGCLGGLDLQAAGIFDEIRSGSACLVLGDRYRAGDTPAGLGRSRIMPDVERGPSREFLKVCEGLDGFATYEGYALARDGRVSPELGAILTSDSVSTLKRVRDDLRKAVAKRLSSLAASGSSQSPREIEDLVGPAISLDVVPLDAECRRIRLLGNAGFGPEGGFVEVALEGGTPITPLEEMTANLIARFPPRKKATAILAAGEEPLAAVALYEAPELGVRIYVLWTQGDVRMFGLVEHAVDCLDLPEEARADVLRGLGKLEAGGDVTVLLWQTQGRHP